MAANPDRIVMALIVVCLAVWVIYRLYIWLGQSPGVGGNIPLNKDIPDHPAVDLLHHAGYEVVGGKLKIPLSFTLDGAPLYSRLFIDYIASLDGGVLYLVILHRPRKAVEWTGSGVRDMLLPYLLIYPEAAGLLYVDTASMTVHKIQLALDDGEND